MDISQRPDKDQTAMNQIPATGQGTKGFFSQKWQKITLCCIFALGIIIAGFWAGGWFDKSVAVTSSPSADQVLSDMSKNLTEQLISDAIAYKNADASNRETALSTLHQTATQRQGYIKALMKEDPDTFLSLAITPDIKDELLQGVEGVEASITLEGELRLIADTPADTTGYSNHRSVHSLLVLSSGETKNLFLPTSMPVTPKPNDLVQVTGYKLDDAFVPNTTADPNNFTVSANATETMDDALDIFGTHQVAFILVNINDTEMPSNFTTQNAEQLLDASKAYYEEASYGNMSLAGKLNPSKSTDIFGIYNITTENLTNNCDNHYMDWHAQARAAAAADGFVSTGYKHIIVQFNNPSSVIFCLFAGRAQLPGTYVWLRTFSDAGTTIHELGHNLGLRHAHSLTNCRINSQNVAFGKATDCTFAEYGDYFSTMGQSSSPRGNPTPHLNSIEKFKLGWIPTVNIATVTTSGVYDLYPSDEPSTGTQVIRIPMPYDLVMPTGQTPLTVFLGPTPFYYYFEMRKPIGVQSNISAQHKADFEGIFLRTGGDSDGNDFWYTSAFLYQLGSLPGAETCTNCITGLRPGMVFEDPYNPDMTVKVLSWTADKATVEVTLSNVEPPTCTRANPTVTVSPSGGMAEPGDSINYTVSVTSNDSASCSAITYTTTPSTSTSGFAFSPASQSWSLSPGASNSQIFAATSPSSAADGLHAMTFTVSNSDNAATVTRNTSFIVASTGAIPPNIHVSGITDGATINPAINTKITATAAHAEGISKVEIYINDRLVARCTEPRNGVCDVSVKGSNTAAGTHTMKVIATAKDASQTTGTANLSFNK